MSRRTINLNRDWTFRFAEGPTRPVGLPHTFDLPYFRTPEFLVGTGWYDRQFDLPTDWNPQTQAAALEFDGVFQVADVSINGVAVGGHRGGYTGFALDVTRAAQPGRNRLAVRVSNEWDPTLAPRAGEHIFCGGIYRDVRLVLTDRLRVAWCGVSVTTPTTTHDSADVSVNVELQNLWDCHVSARLQVTLLSPDGRRVVGVADRAASIAPTGAAACGIHMSPITRPALWHPDHPHLYTAVVQLYDGTNLLDEVRTHFGIRWFQWTPDRGFFLNGDHLYLRGANAHQDQSGWGIGVTRAACERDVRLVKDAGFNFVRGAHYPHNPAFSEACDRLGLLFWSECVFWGKGGFGPEGYWNASAYPSDPSHADAFEQSCMQQLAEMIRIHRNSPSIIAWSMTNEAFFTYHLDRARDLMRKMVESCRRLDPTRPAAIGGAQRGDVDRIGDLAGYNGDGARLFIDPGVPNLVSEYGAISKPHDAFEPFFGDLQPDRFAWRSGQAVWCGFDYGSIAGKQGLKGIVDHQRVPKRSWHWYRQHHLGISPPAAPVDSPPARLVLSSDRTTIQGTDATDDCHLTVTVVDADSRPVKACPVVTLAIESGPGEFATGRSITFDPNTDIPITLGRAAAVMRSYHGGLSRIRATSPGLIDATIQIHTTGTPVWQEGVTAAAAPRPYIPPVESPAARRAMADAVNVALNRPCRATTETTDHPARNANDGERSTAWQADPSDRNPAWVVDLEGSYQVASSRITFPVDGNWRFAISLSGDGAIWQEVVDRRETVNTAAVRNDVYPPGAVARYWRLAIVAAPPGAPPALAEVELFGLLWVR